MPDKRVSYFRSYRAKNRVKIRAYQAQWHRKQYAQNPEPILAAKRRSYLRNREKAAIRSKAYHDTHREQIKLMNQNWRDNNRERYNAAKRSYYHRKIQHERLRSKAKYERNKEAIRNRHREYYHRTKETGKAIARWLKRRAILSGATVNPEAIESFVRRIKSRKRIKCYYCPNVISGSQVHFDHVMPLAKGGLHSVENLCVSCSSCNLKKGSKLLTDWKKDGQQVLSL